MLYGRMGGYFYITQWLKKTRAVPSVNFVCFVKVCKMLGKVSFGIIVFSVVAVIVTDGYYRDGMYEANIVLFSILLFTK